MRREVSWNKNAREEIKLSGRKTVDLVKGKEAEMARKK